MIDFETPPAIGSVLKLDSQDYELVDVRPYVRADGARSCVLIWQTLCPSCGDGIEVTTGLRAQGVVRRCSRCRKIGRPVKGKRGRKVMVKVIEA